MAGMGSGGNGGGIAGQPVTGTPGSTPAANPDWNAGMSGGGAPSVYGNPQSTPMAPQTPSPMATAGTPVQQPQSYTDPLAGTPYARGAPGGFDGSLASVANWAGPQAQPQAVPYARDPNQPYGFGRQPRSDFTHRNNGGGFGQGINLGPQEMQALRGALGK